MKREDKIFKNFIKACYRNYDKWLLQREIEKAGWDVLTRRLQENGLLGFAYNAVKQKKVNLLFPPEILSRWKKQSLLITINNSIYEQEAASVFEAFNQEGLKYVLMKGFVGMEELYGSRYIRPISDLDILVASDQFQKAKDILSGLGYIVKYDEVFRCFAQEFTEVDDNQLHEIPLVKKQGNIKLYIDLHRHVNRYLEGSVVSALFPGHELPWLDHFDEIKLGKTAVRCMKQETQFLFAAHHYILHHMLGGTKWLIDLCQFTVTAGKDLDWQWIAGQVKNKNLNKLLVLALYLARDLTGEEAALKKAAGSGAVKTKPGRLEYLLYFNVPFMKTSIFKRYLVFLLLPCSWSDRIRLLLYLLFDASASIEGRRPGAKRKSFKNALHVLKRFIYRN
jgi:hypothetical protein